MFIYELKKYMSKSKWKIIIVSFLLFICALYSKKNVYEILSLSQLLPKDTVLNAADYFIGIINSSQFIMFFMFPILYTILIADLFTNDFNEGHIFFIFARAKSRLSYVFNKYTFLMFLSICFTFIAFFMAGLVTILFNIPYIGPKYHFIFQTELSILHYISMLITFILGLFFIGLIALFISIYTRSASMSVGLLIIISLVHNAFYVTSSKFLIWLPFSQYIIGLHYEYAPYGLEVPYFTIAFSNLYILCGIFLMGYFIFQKIKWIDIQQLEIRG